MSAISTMNGKKTAGEMTNVDVAAAQAKAVELGKHVLRMTTAAGSGHPSTALALAHIVIELMYRQMRWDPADPWNPTSDRLVLSSGHSVPIVYAAYADLGGVVGRSPRDARPLRVEDLNTLREQNSVLDGHPNPAEGFPFFDAATGSLGQGLSVAAGLALAARLDGIDKGIYCLIGDGESREGQIWEAADFIVDQKLANVCAVFSCNGHGQAAPVSSQQSADAISDKLRAFRWQVIHADGHDPAALAAAFDEAREATVPTAIVAKTVKGWGVDLMLGSNYHGKPVAAAELEKACAQLDATGARLGAKSGRIATIARPASNDSRSSNKTGATQGAITLPSFESACERVGSGAAFTSKKMATRVAYGVALTALGDVDDRIVSLDGDVSNSTYADRFAKFHSDRFFECKIAEQNMISAAAGLAAAGKIPFASSFAKFLARSADQIDMADITRANIKIVGSHSGVSLAADGPSQMSLSDVAYFRSMTRTDAGDGQVACRVFHPSDAIAAYRLTELMANVLGMCYMRTHRPDAAFLYSATEKFDLKGSKQLREGKHLTLASSGYMVHVTLRAADELAKNGITCNVFDVYAFPLDSAPILRAASRAGSAILTVEDNYIGGLHAELAEAAAESGEIRVSGITVNRMPKSARTADEVFSHTGVGLTYILERARKLAAH
ncbi:MAG: transketolase [Planctomycetes bacterium]|nr:transketolase [Planctomycetota bacterium]MBI3835511.1 transketolase [Planctomycetota bacterium]